MTDKKTVSAILFILAALLSCQVSFAATASIIPGTVVIQFESAPGFDVERSAEGVLSTGIEPLDIILKSSEAYSFRAEFGEKYFPEVWVMRYNPEYLTDRIIDELTSIPSIVLVEPDLAVPMMDYTYLPDDLLLLSQWHHGEINSQRGWALSRGSEDVIIGIIDSGVQYTHPDLGPNIWINEAEDINNDGMFDWMDYNNIDEDENGYVDDVVGYDWVNTPRNQVRDGEDAGPPDNDPSDFSGHGTHCAGDAAASTVHGGVSPPSVADGCKRTVLGLSDYPMPHPRSHTRWTRISRSFQ